MIDKEHKFSLALHKAVRELSVFTQPDVTRLEIGTDGELNAARENRLKHMISLARLYVAPLASAQMKQNKDAELQRLKEALVKARDTIVEYTATIEQLQSGSDAERKFAAYALSVIERYNAIVRRNSPEKNQYDYQRQHLLHDPEIQGHEIPLFRFVSVKLDSGLEKHPAQKILKQLRDSSGVKSEPSLRIPITSEQINIDRLMKDSFIVKVLRILGEHSKQQNAAEIRALISQNPINYDNSSVPGVTKISQFLEFGPGIRILLTGSFKQCNQTADSKLITRLAWQGLQLKIPHTGFPYSSQHTGWTLGRHWVDADPGDCSQTPFYKEIEQKRRKSALLHDEDQVFIIKTCDFARLKRIVFDSNRELFIPLHRRLQEAIQVGMQREISDKEKIVMDQYYDKVFKAPSAFDMLHRDQENLLSLFIEQPFSALNTALKNNAFSFSATTPQERHQKVFDLLENERKQAILKLDPQQVEDAFVLMQGELLGKAYQPVGLQYLSKKIGFTPPLLNDFEKKLQISAFSQLLTFIDHSTVDLKAENSEKIKEDLLNHWKQDLQIIEGKMPSNDEKFQKIFLVIEELQSYFHLSSNRS